MNKKQLRQRIKDVAAGAQMAWLEDDEYWDGLCLENLSRFLEGLVNAFGIERDSYLVHFANLDRYETLDSLVEFYWIGQENLNNQ